MTSSVFMVDPVTGKVAFFDEPNTVGDPFDPAAARNAPLLDAVTNLIRERFHVDLDHLEVALAGTTTIPHLAVTGIAADPKLASAYGTNAGGDDNLVVNHGLPYVPICLVAAGSNILWPGMPVQTGVNGAARYATPYVDGTALRVATKATIGDTTLASASISYSYLIFKAPPAASGDILFQFDPDTGIVAMGLGKFSSDRAYLQVAAGGSPLGLSVGRTIDLNNGAPKGWNPDGTTFAPVPAALKTYLPYLTYGGADLGGETSGASMAYAGSYAGPPSSLQVQAP